MTKEQVPGSKRQVGDIVQTRELLGFVQHITIKSVGLKHGSCVVVAKEFHGGTLTSDRVWAHEIIETPTVQLSEFWLAGLEFQYLMLENEKPGRQFVRVGYNELWALQEIVAFHGNGKRGVWVVLINGGIAGAFELRALEASSLGGIDSLVLKGEGGIPDMVIMKPIGIKDDKIAAFLREEKRFRESIRAVVGLEECMMLGLWIVSRAL